MLVGPLLPVSMMTAARAGVVVGWDLQVFLTSNPDFNLERLLSWEPKVASPLSGGQPKLAPGFLFVLFVCHLSLKHQSLRPVSILTLQMEKLRPPKGTPHALSQVLGQCNTPGTTLPSLPSLPTSCPAPHSPHLPLCRDIQAPPPGKFPLT